MAVKAVLKSLVLWLFCVLILKSSFRNKPLIDHDFKGKSHVMDLDFTYLGLTVLFNKDMSVADCIME